MVRIIVNADDFGCNSSITEKTKNMLLKGFISSATIMANGLDVDSAVNFGKEHEEYSFGAHLCLSEYDSLTKDPVLRKYGIIDEKGKFVKYAIFHIDNFQENLLAAIQSELFAQLDFLLNKGLNISHLDSHHHVHALYPLKELFVKTAESYGIKRIRRAQDFDTLRSKLHIIQFLKRKQLNKYYSQKLKTTDLFMPYSKIYSQLSSFDNRNVDSLELMCHPGQEIDEGFEKEIDKILSRPIHKEMEWQLINYNDL